MSFIFPPTFRVLRIAVLPQECGKFLLSAEEMRLHRALRHARYCGDAFDGIAVDELQRDACAFGVGQTGESAVDIHPERLVGAGCGRAHCVEVVGRRAQPAPIVVEHVVGYAEEPCGERRRAAKRPDAGISPYEGVLREVVAQLRVSQRLVEEEAPYRRLILPEGVSKLSYS